MATKSFTNMVEDVCRMCEARILYDERHSSTLQKQSNAAHLLHLHIVDIDYVSFKLFAFKCTYRAGPCEYLMSCTTLLVAGRANRPYV